MRRFLHRSAQFAFFYLLVGFGSVAFGQDATSMTLSNLQSTTGNLVGNKQFVEARPYLEELVARFEGSEQKAALENVYFYLGIGYLVEYSTTSSKDSLTKAIEWFQRMQKEFPNGTFAIKGYLFEADAYRGLADFLAAADIYEKLLKPPFDRMMNYEQRMEVLEKLSQALYIKREWKRGLPWFAMFLKETRNPEHQAMAAAALLEGNIKEGNYDAALEFLRFLVGESPARYNLQLNVALIDAGDKLAKEKRYTEAMLMYRMVLTVEEITNWQKNRLSDLETQLNRLRLTTKDKDNERAIQLETEIFNTTAQIKALEELKSYTSELKVRIARNYLLTNRDWESFYAYKNLIEEYPESTSLESYIYAAFTGATKINKPDAVVGLGEQYLSNPKFVEYRDDIIVKLLEYYKQRGEYLDFFDLSKDFVAKSPDKDYAKSVIFLMGDTYAKLGQYDEMIRQFKDWDKKYPTSPMSPGLYYWIGLGLILQSNYSEAYDYYNKILLDYPESTYAEDSLYRRGICAMGINEFDTARKDFDTYVRKYPNNSQRGEVEFFLGEVDSAQGEVQSAISHYSNVEKYSDNMQFIQNSYVRMGALLEANGQYAEMARIYNQFIEKYADAGELTSAIYQLGRAYELNEQPHLMLKAYIDAISEYGDDPYSYGLDEILVAYPERYTINKERISQNLELLRKLDTNKAYRELIAKDRSAIFTFLSKNPLIQEEIKRALYDQQFRKDLVNSTDEIKPWLAKYEGLNQEFPAETPTESFTRLYKEARENGEETLAIRLQHSLDMLGVQVDPNRIFTEDDFVIASPQALVWVGEQVGKYNQASARIAFEMVVVDHPSSESVFDALLALGDLEMKAGNYDQALALYEQAESAYPLHERSVDAVMKQGDAQRKKSNYAAARDKYKQIATNRDWRGPAHPEALFKSGETYAEEGNLKLAVSSYERVYIGYAAFPEWAAKAYLESGRALQQMGEKEQAKRTYDEFLETDLFKDTESYPAIQQERRSLK